ncbi:MAG: PAS domain S-box protein [Blastocatellia bacterium]|nr:PAS domain S-box protein [Blastocatellia bacterium]
MAECIPQLLWMCDAAGNVIYSSPQWVEYTGRPIIDRTNNYWSPPVHPEDWEKVQEAWQQALTTGTEFKFEFRIRRYDGCYHWFDTRALPMRDETGQIVKWVGTNTDIQEQREMRDALRASEERLRLATEAAQIGTWERDLKTNQLRWSLRQEQLMGYEPGTFPSTYEAFFALVHPEDRQRLADAQQEARRTGAYQVELRFKLADGRERWGLLRGQAIYDEQGQPVRLIGVDMDITERKRDEAALSKSYEQLRLMVEQAPAGIAMLDLNMCYLAASQRWKTEFEIGEQDLIGRSHFEVFPDLPEWAKEVYQKAMAGKIIKNDEDEWTKSDGSKVWVRWAVHPWRTAHNEIGGILISAENITLYKSTEEALRQSKAKLEAVFQTIQDGIAVTDMNGNFLLVNEAETRITGRSSLQGVSPNPAFYTDQFQLTDAGGKILPMKEWPLSRILRGEKITDLELQGRRLDTGQEWCFSYSGEPVRDAQGQPFLAVVVRRDITDHKRAEEALQISEDRLRQLHRIVANADVNHTEKIQQLLRLGAQEFKLENGVLGHIKDAQYSVIQAFSSDNSIIVGFQCQLSEVLCEEVVRRNDWMALEHISATKWREHKARATFGVEVYFAAPTQMAGHLYGTVCFAGKTPRATPFTTGDQEFLRLLAQWIGAELTKHEAEKKLQKAEKRQRMALDAGKMGTWSWDPDTGLIETDEIARNLSGFTAESFEGTMEQAMGAIHPDDREMVNTRLNIALRNRTPYEAECRVIHPDQSVHWIATFGQGDYHSTGEFLGFNGIVFDITARKEAEQQLRLWADAFEHCAHGLVIGNPQTNRIMACNPAFAQMQQWTVEQTVGAPILSLYAPPEQEDVRHQIALADRTGKAQYETYMTRKDGKRIPVQMDVVSVSDQDGKLLYRVATRQDISARKQAEEKLRQSENHFRALFEARAVGSVECEAKTGRFLRVNQKMCEIVGYSAEELQERTFAEITHPEDWDFTADKYQLFITGKVPEYEVEKRYLRKDGSIVWVGVTSSLLLDEEGQPWHTVAVIQDITKRKQAKEELRESEIRFRTLFEQSALGQIIIDDNLKVVDCNRTITQMLGYSHEELLERGMNDFEASPARTEIPPTGQNGNTPFQTLYRTKTGELRNVLVVATNIRIKGKTFGYNSILDITDQKRAEEGLQRERLRLEKIASSSPTVIYSFCITPDGQYTCPYVSAAFFDVYGFSAEEVRKDARITNTRVHPEDLPGLWNSIMEAARTFSRWHHTWRVNHPLKGEIWLEAYSAPVREPDGSITWHGIINDVTEQKRAEQSLRNSEERLKLALAAARMGVWEWDLRTNAVFWSKECYEMLGDNNFDETIEGFTRILHPEDQERIIQLAGQAITQKAIFSAEFRARRANGQEIWLMNLGRAQYDKQGTPTRMIGMVQDITERKRAEAELEKSLEEIRSLATHLQEVREEERKRIARELHDELGQALAGLKFDLAWLESQLTAHDSATAGAFKKKTQMMSKLIDSTIQIGRKIATDLRPRVLDDLGLIAALRWQSRDFQTRTGITCNFMTTTEELPLDAGRATAVFRICQETLTNVLRHAQASTVTIRLQANDNHLYLDIQDNGRGITRQEITGSVSHGLLGMKERVLPYGGTLDIQGQVGKGTTIKVILPLATD